MTLSVIVPLYNNRLYIKECLLSILSQSFTDLEVIVVDDGSTDDGGKICEEICKNDKRVSLITTKNFGQSHARNVGLSIAKGDYILFFDADDYLYNDSLSKIIPEIIKRKPDISVFTYYYFLNQEPDKLYLLPFSFDEEFILNCSNGISVLENLSSETTGTWSPARNIYKRSLLIDEKILFDINLHACEDFDFNLKAALKAKSFYANTTPIFCYRRGRSESISTKKDKIFYLNTFETFNKWVGKLKKNKNSKFFVTIANIYYGELCNLFREKPSKDKDEVLSEIDKTNMVLNYVSGRKRRILSKICLYFGARCAMKVFLFKENIRMRNTAPVGMIK